MIPCPEFISGFEFPQAEIDEAVRNGRLLSLEIEFSQACNFRCPYCYVPGGPSGGREMTEDEIRDVITQACELGARKIIILGGEPMIYRRLRDMIRFIRGKGASVEMFTNGTGMTEEAARFMFENAVKVVLKMNTRKEWLQDALTGRKGAHAVIHAAFENLKKAGYPSDMRLLGISTVICRDNAAEMPEMWAWLRDQGIEPYFEMITPQGSATENEWLYPDVRVVEDVFRKIAELDRVRYGNDWDPQPPLVGSRCLRHQFSCAVNSTGDVIPCVGVNIPVGNIREKRLGDIIRESEVIRDLRNHGKTIKGPCGECPKADSCYGCRGAAYQLTGDYLASDPLCWENAGRQDQIVHLPAPAGGFIPQKETMRVVDSLVAVGERCATVEALVSPANPFAGADGYLDAAAYMEMMAQAIAAMNGFRLSRNGNGHHKGFLLGARNLQILGRACVGDRLSIHVVKHARLGEFGIIRGVVRRGEETVAQGEIKVWHEPDTGRGEHDVCMP